MGGSFLGCQSSLPPTCFHLQPEPTKTREGVLSLCRNLLHRGMFPSPAHSSLGGREVNFRWAFISGLSRSLLSGPSCWNSCSQGKKLCSINLLKRKALFSFPGDFFFFNFVYGLARVCPRKPEVPDRISWSHRLQELGAT